MRLFTEDENRIIKKIVEFYHQAQPDSLVELQVARLLRKKLDIFALQWSIDPIDEIIIYIPIEDFEDKQKIDKQYFDIADFIYFIEELENMGYIKLQDIPTKNEGDFTILYDRDKYEYVKEDKTFWVRMTVPDSKRTIEGKCLVSLKEWRKFNTDFAKDLQRCARSIVYPLPLARDYVDNNFRTLEYRQFKQQMGTALDAAKSGRKAAIFGFFSFLIASASLMYTLTTANKPMTINRMDLERLEYAIKANHLAEPLEIMTGDTLAVKQVSTPPETNKSK